MLRRPWRQPITRALRPTAEARMSSGAPANKIFFGPFEVTSQVFLTTPHSFALVNLKPLLPGHVLVCPSRPHRRLTDLSLPEVTDLFASVQRVQRMLARRYFPPGGSFNIAVQDGPEAGQTVAHVHVHVIPRVRGLSAKPEDTAGDELYERMAGEEGNVGGALWDRQRGRERGGPGLGPRPVPGGAFDRIEDSQRKARSMEEMEAEAEMFRGTLEEMEEEDKGGQGATASGTSHGVGDLCQPNTSEGLGTTSDRHA